MMTPVRILFVTMVLVFLFLALSGALEPVWTPDTRGYVAPWNWDGELWGRRRTPVLGYLLAPFGSDFALYPLVIVLAFFGSVALLFQSAVRFGVSEHAALALTLPLVLSNSLLRYSREIHAEFPALTLILFSLSFLVRLNEQGRRSIWIYLGFTV
jgi:hypothetical protein